MRRKIENYLLEIGITPNLKGFCCICEAVEEIILNHDEKLMAIYCKVGEKLNISDYSVERTIRHAVQREKSRRKTTNSEFLYGLALKVRREIEDEQSN